jgi:TatD DNase family protein
LFIDSHCHLDRLELDKLGMDLPAVLTAAAQAQVDHMLCVSVSLQEFPAMAALVSEYPQISVSCGEHPLHQQQEFSADQLLILCQSEQVVAVGETGLDYFYSPDNKTTQQAAFAEHISVARQLNKPLIVHTRDARVDTLALLRGEQAQDCGGVLHCFTEDWDTAKAALDLGFYISFSGIMTFRNADALRDVVRQVPLDRLLIETDSPYLAPVPYRGKTNQPAYVAAVAKAIAELKGIDLPALGAATSQNFCRLFPLAKV